MSMSGISVIPWATRIWEAYSTFACWRTQEWPIASSSSAFCPVYLHLFFKIFFNNILLSSIYYLSNATFSMHPSLASLGSSMDM
jgi:hypothetical protein